MPNANKTKHIVLSASIVGVALLVSFGIVAYGASAQDIVFPVAELGNCANEAECRAYCDRAENYEVCIAFAEKHDLIDERQAEKSKKLVSAIKKGGPGGCTSQDSCEAYCENISHIEECLAFAGTHDMMDDEEIREAKQIAQALRSGANLPGGCTTKKECESYCEDGRNIRACIAFAEKAGLMSAEELAEAKKIMPLMERGEMPGGCTSEKECNSYCSKPDNRMECMEFALKAGFMTEKEAEMMRKTGGKGPGDCSGREECEAFCNDSANRRVCIDFAMEHGLMSEEEIRQMEEGMAQFKKGLDNAPPEVAACLKSRLGETVITRIQSGELMPGPEIGDQMRSCFDEFSPRVSRSELENRLSQIPVAARACLTEKLGSNYVDVLLGEGTEPHLVGDVGRECMDNAMFDQMSAELSRMPAEVQRCIQARLGTNYIERLRAGEISSDAVGPAIKECVEQNMPAMPVGEMPPQEGQSAPGAYQQSGELPYMPPEVQTCMQQLYGSDVLDRMKAGAFIPPADMQTQVQQCVMRMFQSPSM